MLQAQRRAAEQERARREAEAEERLRLQAEEDERLRQEEQEQEKLREADATERRRKRAEEEEAAWMRRDEEQKAAAAAASAAAIAGTQHVDRVLKVFELFEEQNWVHVQITKQRRHLGTLRLPVHLNNLGKTCKVVCMVHCVECAEKLSAIQVSRNASTMQGTRKS